MSLVFSNMETVLEVIKDLVDEELENMLKKYKDDADLHKFESFKDQTNSLLDIICERVKEIDHEMDLDSKAIRHCMEKRMTPEQAAEYFEQSKLFRSHQKNEYKGI